jgi:hypothetical protein
MYNFEKEEQKKLEIFYEKTISNISLLNDTELQFEFTDGSSFIIFDNGQTCCEERYLTTEDDLSSFIGDQFLEITEKNYTIEDLSNGSGDAECLDIEVQTNKGFFSFQCHNDHNGYYGGFDISIK